MRSACEAIEHSTLYFAWRSIVAELIDLDPSALAAGDREPLVDRLSAALESPELVPLLGDLLGVALPDTSLTAEMQGEVRADNTSELVVRLCARRAAGAPLILCIEDVHWMDSASWSLLLKLRHQIPRLLMLLLTRPMAAPPVELQRMREHPATHVLRLEPLPASDCAALVAARLGIPALPDAIAQWVQERAEGHPFFAEELGYAIRDAGILEVSNGHCELAAGSEDLAALDLPDTVEGIITSRIDRLETDAQLTLKVASVIGRSFELPVLAAIHPLGTTVAQLDRQLDGLSRLELTCREQVGAQCAHLFKHAITRQVAYGLMLFSQRHALHAEIAAFFETRPAEELRSLAPLLAHHWGHAGVAEKAIGYLEQAAESALRSHANAEAIGFLRDALEWSRTDETRVSERRRTSWIAMLGEAEIGMGRLSEARRHLEEVVERLGYEIPAASSGLIAALAREIARQCGLRWARRAAIRREDERGEDAALAARACERLFLIYFFAGDAPRALLGTLRAVNLAERSRSAGDVLARCFASLGVALGSIPLHRMARAYLSRALASCDPHALSARSWIHLGAATYWAGVGAWDQVESHARQGLELAEQLGDWRRWEELAASLCLMRMIHGELDASDAALHAQVLASGRRREVVQAQGWGLCEAALTLCALEDWKSLSPVLDQVEQLLARHGDQVDVVTRLEGRAALARSAVAHGDSNRAHTLLETALRDLTAMGPPTQYRNLPGVSTLVEALLAAIDDCIDPVQLLLYDAWLERISGYLRRYARMFAIGRSRRDFVRAQIERRRGRLRRARTWLEASLQHARRSNLRIDELRALEALAAMGAVGDPDAALARGRELRRQLGLPARSLPAGVSRRGSSC